MKILLSLLLAALAFAAAITPVHARDEIGKGDVVVVPLHGEVSETMFLFLRRVQKAAEAADASALVLDMNTYGGRLDSAEKITKLLHQATIPTYTFINTNAGSAGALIALATKDIYMAPVSAIGAAAPIMSSGEDLGETAREKTISYWSALIRGSATRNGHNPDIGEAFMNKEKEVKIGDRVINPKGRLLTLNAQEASDVIDGKPVLARGIADSINELVRKADLKGEVVTIKPTGFERLAFWITALAPLLLLGGMIGLWLEFKIPGAGLPAVIAAVCFALFFLGHYFAGLAGWEVVALFVAGVLLVLAEILVFAHTTILVGVIGVFLMLGALLWAMIDRYPGQRLLPTGEMIRLPLMNLMIAIVATIIVGLLLARFLPRTSVYKRFVLAADIPSGPSLTGAPREFGPAYDVSPGTEGRAITTLRPSGKAQFADHVVDVVTEGEFVPAETAVRVVSSDGMRVVVKAA
ncbi:MAG TPA: NfeD family protein [Chthoniobacterales bacterium]|nr:NfeD family protein [Chthoniobacterales bacterium]